MWDNVIRKTKKIVKCRFAQPQSNCSNWTLVLPLFLSIKGKYVSLLSERRCISVHPEDGFPLKRISLVSFYLGTLGGVMDNLLYKIFALNRQTSYCFSLELPLEKGKGVIGHTLIEGILRGPKLKGQCL